jgi:signal transduction histidine kinase
MAQGLQLYRKLKFILIFRAVFLTILAVLSVMFTTFIMEDVLIKSALRSEADYFWEKKTVDAEYPAPDTWNLKSYFSAIDELDALPEYFRDLPLGFTQIDDEPGYTLVYKTVQNRQQLLLLFNGENVHALVIILGIVPLVLFLLLSYLVGWLFYRKAKQFLSPIGWLAQRFEVFDPVSARMPEFDLNDMPSDADYETLVLANSLANYTQRINEFVNRERAFTRDVSHELRTPLTVAKMAVNIMEDSKTLDGKDRASLARIKQAMADMLELVEVFLILSRESDANLVEEEISVFDIVEYELIQLQPLLDQKENKIEVKVDEVEPCSLKVSGKIVEVLLGNLIQNAIKYTDKGEIRITINKTSVEVKDTGIGMTEDQIKQVFKPFFQAGSRPSGGYGVGLNIVKRITERFHWDFSMESVEKQGTSAKVIFSSETEKF